jgi:hypothetical protein
MVSLFHPSYTLGDVQWVLDCNNSYGGLAGLIGVRLHGGMDDFLVYQLLQVS